jgi:hypothetical protein
MLIAPLAASAAQPAGAPAVTSKTVKQTKTHKRHVAKHHARGKTAKHARHHGKVASHKRHGKIAKQTSAHKRTHVAKVHAIAR